MSLRVGDYVKYRFISMSDYRIGRIVGIYITHYKHKSYRLYNIGWCKADGLITTGFARKELEKISEKEAVIEML